MTDEPGAGTTAAAPYARRLILDDDVAPERVEAFAAEQGWLLAADLTRTFHADAVRQWSAAPGVDVAYLEMHQTGMSALEVSAATESETAAWEARLRRQLPHVSEAAVAAVALATDDPVELLRAVLTIRSWDVSRDDETTLAVIDRALEHPAKALRQEALSTIWSRRGEPLGAALRKLLSARLSREDELRDPMTRLLEAMTAAA